MIRTVPVGISEPPSVLSQLINEIVRDLLERPWAQAL